MRKGALISILAAAAAVLLASAGPERAGAVARAYNYQCCVDAGLTATYDATSKQITASFNVPYPGLEAHNIVWGPTQDSLKHVTGGGTARNTGTINPPTLGGPTSGRLTFPVTGVGDILVQVTFQCQWSAADKCMPGKSGDAIDLDWVLSTPVKVNIGKADGTTKPTVVRVTPTAVPKSNGSKACNAARAKIVYANSEIQKAVNNLNVANALNDNAKVQTIRQKQLTQRLAQLRGLIAVYAKNAAKACR